MQNKNDGNEKENESIFERLVKQDRRNRFAQNEGLFFGICVMFALYATQGMFTIP